MGRVLLVFALGLGAYLAWTEVVAPRVAARGEEHQSDEASLACVEAAEGVDVLFDAESAALVANSKALEQGAWAESLVRLSSALAHADSACRCPTEACASATGALYELRRLLGQMDRTARGHYLALSGAEGRRQLVRRLLKEARAGLD